MMWVNILVVLVIFLSFFGGLKEGAVKRSFSLLAFIIAIPLAGLSYRLMVTLLSFLPGENWENFFGFFITLGVISAILQLLFLLPRKLIHKAWHRGVLFRLAGGTLNIFNVAIGLVLFTFLIQAYPIIEWLAHVVHDSKALTWLVARMSFIVSMLPEVFQDTVTV